MSVEMMPTLDCTMTLNLPFVCIQWCTLLMAPDPPGLHWSPGKLYHLELMSVTGVSSGHSEVS